ncbi:hypothetical protein BC781_101801 [Sediminitomix flava]|uniref:DUF2255 family protein n=2 Tax=Sediminitomix flava TaxID=379075 RepID=A0A315ZG02_SEDFL|nr:hypothetical protein BC781_101801 [Sediminitomix flava]
MIFPLSILMGEFSYAQQNKIHSIADQDYVDLINCINATPITTIRQGDTHPFIDMWMVVVDDRIFSRSWLGDPKGWYYKFLEDKKGAIQCGDKFYQIEGIIPDDLDAINEKINTAYIQKYGDGDHPEIAKQMIEAERMARTLELKVIATRP